MGLNLGIFGGAFDPPHISHTLACLYALETQEIDRILVIPCYRHPLEKKTSPFVHRLAMTRLAMDCLKPRVEVSDMEADREGPSYTIDTLRILNKSYPEANLCLLVGSDILEETHEWKEFNEVKQLAQLVFLPRPRPEKNNSSPAFTLPDISSTEIRERLKNGKNITPFISRKVLEYIQYHKLYTS